MTKEWEEQQADRINALAVMAATLEAGDRACGREQYGPQHSPIQHETDYARRALDLYKAVEDAAYPDAVAAEARG